MEQIIYLDADDQIAGVNAALGRAQPGRVSLVVPARSRVFQSLVNLKLLQRFADHSGLTVTLITGDHTTRTLAHELGIPVRSALRKGAARPDAQPPAGGAVPGHDAAPEPPSAPLQAAAGPTGGIPRAAGTAPARPDGAFQPAPALRMRRQAGRLAGLRPPSAATTGQRIFGYGLLLVFLAAVGLGVLLLAPDAVVDLTPASEPVTRSIAVKAGTDVRSTDVARGQIPARLVQVTLQDSSQTDATGRKQEPAQRATGRVVVTNRSGSAVNVPQGTAVRTGTGTLIRFLTSAPATVEANSFTQVPIVAELAGSGSNLPAWSISQLEGSLSFALSVVNDTPTSGGTEQQAQLVTAADRVRLREALFAKMKDTTQQAVRSDLKPGEILLENTVAIRVEDESFDREIGEVSKSVGLRIRMTASSLAIPGDALNKLALEALKDALPAGGELIAGSVTVGKPLDVQIEGQTATFRFVAEANSVVGLDLQQVRRDILGLTVPQAEQLLVKRYRLNRDPDITLQNGWLGRLPLLGFRIQVVLTRS